jgi:phosphoglycerol transferase
VACSQEHIAALVEKIKASPYFKNTVIVVSSDHLAMKNSAWDALNKQDRTNLFFVLRGDQPQQEVIATKRNSMDNGATVLDILGEITLLVLAAARCRDNRCQKCSST